MYVLPLPCPIADNLPVLFINFTYHKERKKLLGLGLLPHYAFCIDKIMFPQLLWLDTSVLTTVHERKGYSSAFPLTLKILLLNTVTGVRVSYLDQ